MALHNLHYSLSRSISWSTKVDIGSFARQHMRNAEHTRPALYRWRSSQASDFAVAWPQQEPYIAIINARTTETQSISFRYVPNIGLQAQERHLLISKHASLPGMPVQSISTRGDSWLAKLVQLHGSMPVFHDVVFGYAPLVRCQISEH